MPARVSNAALAAKLDTLIGLLVAQAAPASAPEAPKTAATPVAADAPVRSKDGRDFPCTATPACGRFLRSAKRAAVHGVDAGGHEPRS